MRIRMPGRRPVVWFALAALLAVGAMVLMSRTGSASGGSAQVVVARTVIPAGTLLDEDFAARSLAMAPVPDDLRLSGLQASASGVIGRRTVAPLAPGEPVTDAVIGGAPGVGPAPLLPGERAVPVPLRAAGGPVAAPPEGSRVDVIASDGEGMAGRTRVIVSNAEVLAVTPSLGADAADVAGGLVLRLRTADALEVARALDFAREVRVIARPAGEG
jgi:Flp pilus assembly protein CpaB